ncbi:general stress protein [Nocardiopsis sp. NPDC057823]|uniref:general stress protein n=1 Tax=Nocardiopsis TaxID=2013 RepID=UPI00159ADE3B|nr:magnesium transporter [Nocardiopsis flavescens]
MFSPDPRTLPTPPTGWSIGSYTAYAEAQRAVDHLAANGFPVEDLTIVGTGPRVVERVTGRLTWGRVLGSAALSGVWFGLLIGVVLGMFTPGGLLGSILAGLLAGVGAGTAFAAMGYASLGGKRTFASRTEIVAERYEVLSEPRSAERGRDLLARLALTSPAH